MIFNPRTIPRVALIYVLAAAMLAAAWGASLALGAKHVRAAGDEFHGISPSRSCQTASDGSAYNCTFSVINSSLIDTAGDTLELTGVTDIVSSGSTQIASDNVLASLTVDAYLGGAQCYADAGSAEPTGIHLASTGALSVGDSGAAICVLPSNSRVQFASYGVDTSQAPDQSTLTDQLRISWQDQCDGGSTNCPRDSQVYAQDPVAFYLERPAVPQIEQSNGDGAVDDSGNAAGADSQASEGDE